MRALLDGRDALVVMPTGWGKSAIYQIAAAILPGSTVVVSPLISLQKDQVDALEEKDAGAAGAVNSSMPNSQRQATLSDLQEEDLEFLFLAPEQFGADDVLEHIREGGPSLFVIDEAHCISEWGHDFRPDYLRLGAVADALGDPRPVLLALTATASPHVREEIRARLRMEDALEIVLGFDRPNIRLSVDPFLEDDERIDSLVSATLGGEKPGIVYARTRKRAEDVARRLEEGGVAAAVYHAGLGANEREEIQDRFMGDDLEVVVATIAFGLGIDKPNVRFVHHLDTPGSIDAYYQQFGRAGRDGLPAEARLFHRQEDLGRQRFLSGTVRLEEEAMEALVAAVQESEGEADDEELREATGLSRSKLATGVGLLEDAGVLSASAEGGAEQNGDEDASPKEAAARAVELLERKRAFQRSQLEMIRGYVETRDCRREYLLNYLGEAFEGPCGNCDNCDAGLGVDEEGELPFPVHSEVVHSEWGRGVVQRYEGDKVTVLFDTVGYKALSIPLVLERELLTPA